MTSNRSVLTTAFNDLEDAISDFRDTPAQGVEHALARFVHVFDTEPMAGFLSSVLPEIDFSAWWEKAQCSGGSFAASRVLSWPSNRAERVATQIALCRNVIDKRISFMTFAFHFYYSGDRSLSSFVTAFAEKLLRPLVRDIDRLAESRQISPILFAAMQRLPETGDETLDALLLTACTKFKDPALQSRREATEKLWDGWERLKSLDISVNKKASVEALLACASEALPFRQCLETEAKELTAIGNHFHIRHFETDRHPLKQQEQVDYLFHRMFAFLQLLLVARGQKGAS